MSYANLDHAARTNNVECWEARISVVTCAKCGDFDVEIDRAHATDPATCPSCEGTDCTVAGTTRTGWFWWTCCPGCLPDSDMFGPFDTEQEALEDAVGDLMDDV